VANAELTANERANPGVNLGVDGKRLIDEAIGRHIANEERLLLSLTEAEQETLSALLKKLIAGL
jgi:DNA-binding MarR family transcriptional regulator